MTQMSTHELFMELCGSLYEEGRITQSMMEDAAKYLPDERLDEFHAKLKSLVDRAECTSFFVKELSDRMTKLEDNA